MAKLSNLPGHATPSGTDLLVVVHDGVTKRSTVAQLLGPEVSARQAGDGSNAAAIAAEVARATGQEALKLDKSAEASSAEAVAGAITGKWLSPVALKAAIDAALNALVNGAPGSLNQLNELATAMGNDPNFATTMINALATKFDKAGGLLSGNLGMQGYRITGLPLPTTNDQPARAGELSAEITRATGQESLKLDKTSNASSAEAIAGLAADKWVPPVALKAAIDTGLLRLEADMAPDVVPSGFTPIDQIAFGVLDEGRGLLAPMMRNDGRLMQTGPDGAYETVPLRTEIARGAETALLVPLIGGETPLEVEIDEATGIITRVITSKGHLWLLNHSTGSLEKLAAPAEVALLGSLIDSETAVEIETDEATGIVTRVITKEGHLWLLDHSTGKLGKVSAATSAEAGLLSALIGGETPAELEVDEATGIISRVVTKEAGLWLLNHSTGLLERAKTTAAETVPPLAYTAEEYATGKQTIVNYYLDGDVCLILPTLGQSNGYGQNSDQTDPVIATVPIYPSDALMFTGGPNRTVSTHNLATAPLVESFVPGRRETAASGWANHLIRDIETATGVRARTLSFVTARGSSRYMQLKRGTATYVNFLSALDDAVAVCRSNGWTPYVPAIDWMQGESDTDGVAGTSPARYARQMQQFSRHLQADVIARTGQADPPVLLITQIAFTPSANNRWEAPATRAAVMLDGLDNIRLVGPLYPFPFLGDDVHATSLGQNRRGQAIARATLEEIFGTGWRGVKPVAHRWTSTTTFKIDFTAHSAGTTAPSLILDTSGDFITTAGLPAHGFEFDDGSGTPLAITSVAISGLSVTITLAFAPTGTACRFGYALARTSGTSAGPVTGARGTLRDNASHPSLYDGGRLNHNWCPSFVIETHRP